MITFDTLKEYLDYIPNCIICEKPMTFYILGNVRGYYAVNKNYYNKVSMKMIMVDNLLKSKNNAPIKDSNRQPSFFKFVRIFFSSACLERISHL